MNIYKHFYEYFYNPCIKQTFKMFTFFDFKYPYNHCIKPKIRVLTFAQKTHITSKKLYMTQQTWYMGPSLQVLRALGPGPGPMGPGPWAHGKKCQMFFTRMF